MGHQAPAHKACPGYRQASVPALLPFNQVAAIYFHFLFYTHWWSARIFLYTRSYSAMYSSFSARLYMLCPSVSALSPQTTAEKALFLCAHGTPYIAFRDGRTVIMLFYELTATVCSPVIKLKAPEYLSCHISSHNRMLLEMILAFLVCRNAHRLCHIMKQHGNLRILSARTCSNV